MYIYIYIYIHIYVYTNTLYIYIYMCTVAAGIGRVNMMCIVCSAVVLHIHDVSTLCMPGPSDK